MRRLLLLALSLLLTAPAWAQGYDALVVSQGAFGGSNGSVVAVRGDGPATTASPLATGRIYTQGAEVVGERLYLTAGDSFSGTSRVDVLDTATGELVGQFTGDGIVNPRYLAVTAGGTAFVSNQDYSGGPSFVTPVALGTRTVGTPIEVEGTPEGVAVADLAGGLQRVFVALGAFGGRDSLAVVDPATATLTGYVDIDCAARFVIATPTRVWAVCTDTDEVVGVDPATLAVVRRTAFDVEIGDPNGIGQDAAPALRDAAARRSGPPTADAFAVSTATGVAFVDGATGEVVRTVAIAGLDTRPITALGTPTVGGPLYLGRPDPDNPFGAAGTVTVHDGEGTLRTTLAAGVFPSYVAVDPDAFASDAASGPAARGLAVALVGPNPARGRTAVAVTLDRPATVRVEVVDVLGRVVATTETAAAAGTARVEIEAGALAPGRYLVRATAGDRAGTLALTVAR